MADEAVTRCLGRFSFAIPPGMTDRGREQSFDFVDVTVLRAVEGVSPAAGWRARLAEIAALPIPLDADRPIVREVELAADLPGVFHYGGQAAPEMLVLEAQTAAGDWLIRWRTKSLAGGERQMADAVRRVAGAFKLRELGTTLSGFCVGPGSIQAESQTMERARVRYVDEAGLDLSLASRRVNRVDAGGPPARDTAGTIAGAARMGIRARVVRAGPRLIAGLAGEEQIISVHSGGDAALHFLWHFDGLPKSSREPLLDIEMKAPARIERDAIAVWDSLLASLHRHAPSR